MDNYDPSKPGFDPGFFVGTQPDISTPIRAASDILVDLDNNLALSVATPLKAAGDIMNKLLQKPTDKVNAALNQASEYADGLTGKVEQVLAGKLGQAGEIVANLESKTPIITNAWQSNEQVTDKAVPIPPQDYTLPLLHVAPLNPKQQMIKITDDNGVDHFVEMQNLINVKLNEKQQQQVNEQVKHLQVQNVIGNEQQKQLIVEQQLKEQLQNQQLVQQQLEQQLQKQNEIVKQEQLKLQQQQQQVKQQEQQKQVIEQQVTKQQVKQEEVTQQQQNKQIVEMAFESDKTKQEIVVVGCKDNGPPFQCYSDPATGWTCKDSSGKIVYQGWNPPPLTPSGCLDKETIENTVTIDTNKQMCQLQTTDIIPPLPGTYCSDLKFPISSVTSGQQYNLAASMLGPLFADLQANTDMIEKLELQNDATEAAKDGSGLASLIAHGINRAAIELKGEFLSGLWTIGSSISGTLETMAKVMVPLGGCASPSVTASAATLTGIGLLDKYVGGPWDYFATPLTYTIRGGCPVFFPGVEGGQAAYLGDNIDLDVLKNWVAIAGYCWEPYSKVLESAKSKPIPNELLQMNRRKIITDEEYNKGMRRLGYVDSKHIEHIKQIGEYAPPPQDVVRFMVRDTANKDVVTTFELDKNFDDNYNGQLKEWAKWSGVSDEYMKHLWRAHWDVPSPTQLYEMLHRLSALDATDPRYVDINIVRKALVQQDIAPYWVEKFIAISYSPLTRVDVRRAYNIGVLDRAGVKRAYLDNGYNVENAETLTKFTEKEKMRAGFSHESVKRYVAGRASALEMQAALIIDGYSAEQVTKIYERATKSFRWQWAGKCVAATKKRYMIGEFDADKTRGILIGFGMDGSQADIVIEGWQCELAARGREFTAAQLIKLLDNGLLNPQEFVNRLRRLGYREEDGVKILTQWQIKQQLTMQKLSEKQNKELEKQLMKQAAQAEKAKRQLERAQQQDQRAGERARQAQDRRDNALVKAARDYSVQEGIDIEAAYSYVKGCYTEMRKEYSLSLDESVQAVVVAIEKRPPSDEMELCKRIREVAEAMIDADKTVG